MVKNNKKNLIFICFLLILFFCNIKVYAEEKNIDEIIVISDSEIKGDTISTCDDISLIKTDDVNKTINKYKKDPRVKYVFKNTPINLCQSEPDDIVSYDERFGKKLVQAEEYMSVIPKSRVRVGVIDFNFHCTNKDFKDQYNKNLSFTITGGQGNYDYSKTKLITNKNEDFHGSRVASIIGAKRDNHYGIDGIASINNNKYLDLILINPKELSLYDILCSMKYAKDINCQVINCSFSLSGNNIDEDYCKYIDELLKEIKDSGCTIVAASGNENEYTLEYPAASKHVIGVIGSNDSGTGKDPFSDYGPYLNVCAPMSVFTMDGNEFSPDYGTSYSTPIVTSLVAYIKMINPNYTPDQVQNILQSTAEDLCTKGKDDKTAFGKINPIKAIKKVFYYKYKRMPVFKLYDRSKKCYFYTTSIICYTSIKKYIKKGVIGYSPLRGKGVYQLKKNNSFYYTTSKNKIKKLKKKGWILTHKGKPVFFSSGNKNIYQAQNRRNKKYYYTTNINKYKRLNKKWKRNGIAFKII